MAELFLLKPRHMEDDESGNGGTGGWDMEDQDKYLVEAAQKSKRKFEDADSVDRMDEQLGFQRHISPIKRKGWLINVHSVSQRVKCYLI